MSKLLLCVAMGLSLSAVAYSQATGFTYQGLLTDSGAPANGTYNLRFDIYASYSGGTPLAETMEVEGLGITNGLFTVVLDFGDGIFTGGDRWLEISVRPRHLSAVYVPLRPRRPITPTPYATAAGRFTGVIPSGGLAGVYASPVSFSNGLNFYLGSFEGDGRGLRGLSASNLAGALPSHLLEGTYGNAVSLTNDGNLFRGRFDGDGRGLANLNAAALAEGKVPDERLSTNVAFLNSSPVFRGSVTIHMTDPLRGALAVNGPAGMTGSNAWEFGASVPGKHPHAGKIGYETLTPGALDIVGAGTNLASRRIKFWAEAGATFNAASANNVLALLNTIDEPTFLSLIAPYRTWRVGQNKPPNSPGLIDAFFIYDETAGATRLLITDTGYVGLGTNNPSHPLHLASGARCTPAGVWTSVSDRDAKEEFTAIESREVLAKVAALPIAQYKYRIEAAGLKHIGPTAQDFYAAFGLGEDERTIGAVDAAGVALAAIQGLNKLVDEKNSEIQALKARSQVLERRLEAVESLLRRQLTPNGQEP